MYLYCDGPFNRLSHSRRSTCYWMRRPSSFQFSVPPRSRNPGTSTPPTLNCPENGCTSTVHKSVCPISMQRRLATCLQGSPTPYCRSARTKCRRKSDLKFVVDLFLFAAIDTAPAKPVVRVQGTCSGTCNWMNEASSCCGNRPARDISDISLWIETRNVGFRHCKEPKCGMNGPD